MLSPLLRYVSRGDRFSTRPTEFREITCWFDFLAKLWRNFSVELERTTDSALGLNLMLDLVGKRSAWNFSTPFSVLSVDAMVGFFTPSGDGLVSERRSANLRRLSSEVLASGVVAVSVDMIWVVDSIWRLCILFRGTKAAVIFLEFSSLDVCVVSLSPKPPLHMLESRRNSLAFFISVVWSTNAQMKLGIKFFRAFQKLLPHWIC